MTKVIISHPKDISLRIPPFPLYNKFDKLEFAKQNSHTTYGRFYPNLYTVWSLFGIKSKRLMPLAKSQWHLSFPGCSRSKFYRQFHRCQPLLHSNWRELNLSYPAFWQKLKPVPFMKTSEFQKKAFSSGNQYDKVLGAVLLTLNDHAQSVLSSLIRNSG